MNDLNEARKLCYEDFPATPRDNDYDDDVDSEDFDVSDYDDELQGNPFYLQSFFFVFLCAQFIEIFVSPV